MSNGSEKGRAPFLYLNVALLMAVVFCLYLIRIIGLDIWWHLGVGRYLIQARSFPYHDVFSFTAPYWDNKEWLFGIFVYLVERLGGLGALSFAKAMLFTATFFTLFVVSLRRSRNSFLSIAVVLLAALACRIRLAFRPELFTYLFLAILFLMIDKFFSGKRRPLCFFPLLMLLWVNLHPLAFLGLIILLIYIAGDLVTRILKEPAGKYCWRRLSNRDLLLLAMIFVASCVAFTCNPISLYRILSPVELLTKHSTYIASLTETTRLPISEYPPSFIAVGLLALFTLVMFFTMMEPASTMILVFFGLLFVFVPMPRNIPLLPVCWTPIIACQLARFFSYLPPGVASFFRSSRRIADGVFSVLLVCLIVWALSLPSFGVGFSGTLFPERAIEYVTANAPEKEMFNIYDWGGFLIWKLYPRYRVFIDGRGPDAYPPEIWADYQAVQGGEEGWEEILDKYGVNFVLLSTGNKLHDLIGRLDEAPGWRLAYWDHVCDADGRPLHPLAIIFVRDTVENRALIDAYKYRLLDTEKWTLSPWSPAFELQAIGELDNYLKENPGALDARNLLAVTFMRKDMVDRAIGEYERIAADYPKVATLHYNLGMLYSRKGDEDRALAEYEKEIRLNRKFPPAYNNLGRILYTRGDLAGAASSYKKALKYEPMYVPAINNLGIIYMEKGEYKKAASEFKRAIEIDPAYEASLRNLAMADGMLTRPAETANELGQMFYGRGDYEKAEEHFRLSLKHDSRNAVAINNLGAIYLKKGEYEEAMQAFKKALEIYPSYEGARQNLHMAESMLQEGPVPAVTQ